MSAGFLRNGSKSYLSIQSLLQKQPATDPIRAAIIRGRPHHRQQQSRVYARFTESIYRRTRDLDSSASGIVLSSPFSSSTTASSQKNGLVGWYLGMVKSRPILTKSITGALIYTAADLSSQIIVQPSSESYDVVRTLRMAGYGMLILGPSLHFWFNFVSKVLPKRDIMTTLKKIVMGQILFGPAMTVIFFSVNAALQGENAAEITARLKRDLLPTMINGVLYWPICDFVTFKFIPVQLQPLVSNSFSYLWTVYMTYMASLEKASSNQ
ncbi:protein sym-1-like [Rhododendron vialii]|uniref:protein sym-1-like n=1 Tax=Rhododendron vialii TaxID=182163 RepID=UPI00266021F4|nr:protein sym-1-like [Rhododendron vialii]